MPIESFSSVPAMFLHRVKATPDADAFYYPDKDDNWRTLTWKDVEKESREIAGGLHSLGLGLEDRCAIASNTRYEWVLVDIGILCAGGATTTIYPSTSSSGCSYIVNDSGTKVLFAENQEQVDKFLSVKDEMQNLEKIVIIDGKSQGDFVISLDELKTMGKEWLKDNMTTYDERIQSIQSHNLATLIYTSGTTGKPKGVELLHDCWVFEAETIDNIGIISPNDKQFLWLPLSHSFGKVLEVISIRIGFPTAIDGRIDRIVPNLAEVKPTFVAAVPRIFEKVYNKVITGARQGGKLKYEIFKWSQKVGQQVSALRQNGIEPKGVLRLQYKIADRLVYSKLRATFGGKLKFFISGSAPLSAEIAAFFHASNILILEGYGLTESSAASFINLPSKFKFGTVGFPLPGVEYKLAEADDEILISGRGIMRGYYNLPDVNADTLQTDSNGKVWLHTGDIGRKDKDGFLKIVDRKKDLIKTSGGKYVAPQKIEGKIKAMCTYVASALVHGNARNYCSMLITLDEENIKKWSEEAGLENLSYEELTQHPSVKEMLQSYVDQLNSGLDSYETIKKFAILKQDFTQEAGEITPSLKVKRKVVEANNKEILDGFYTSSLEQM